MRQRLRLGEGGQRTEPTFWDGINNTWGGAPDSGLERWWSSGLTAAVSLSRESAYRPPQGWSSEQQPRRRQDLIYSLIHLFVLLREETLTEWLPRSRHCCRMSEAGLAARLRAGAEKPGTSTQSCGPKLSKCSCRYRQLLGD